LVRLDPGGELDLVAVGVEAATGAGVEADDATLLAEPAHVSGKSTQRATRELLTGRHVYVAPLRPPALPQRRQFTCGPSLRAFELGTISADQKPPRLTLHARTPAPC